MVWGPTEDTGCWPALSGVSGLRGDERASYGEPGAHFVGICWRGHHGFKDQSVSAALRAGPLPSALSPGRQPLPSFENSLLILTVRQSFLCLNSVTPVMAEPTASALRSPPGADCRLSPAPGEALPALVPSPPGALSTGVHLRAYPLHNSSGVPDS